jgi:hypothetical protein
MDLIIKAVGVGRVGRRYGDGKFIDVGRTFSFP